MIKYKIPKNIVRPHWKTNIIVLFVASVLLASTFVSLSIIDGIKNNIKKNIIQNYDSHLTIHPQRHELGFGIDSLWKAKDQKVDKLTDNEYIRGVTTRSTFKALYHQTPITLTTIEDRDSNVFNHDFLPSDMDSTSALNKVYIGRQLAQKHNIQEGDKFPFTILLINKHYEDFTVGGIFDSHDVFYDQYGVFIHAISINKDFNSRFQKYHVRFLASPLISLVESVVAKDILRYNKTYTDDHLKFQYLQLNTLTNTINQWIWIMYAFIGMVFLLLHYFSYSQQDLIAYIHRTGFISNKKPVFQILRSCFSDLITATILAILITIGFTYIELNSLFLFLDKEPFYQQYNFPMTYTFFSSFPNLWSAIPGILIGILSGVMLFIFLQIKPSDEQPLVIIILGIVLFGGISSYEYTRVNFAKSARDNLWGQYFYGKYMLTGQNYHQQNSFNAEPNYFSVPLDNYNIFQENQLSYMSSIETYGLINYTVTTTNKGKITNSIISKDVSVKSLQGNLVQLSNILSLLSEDKIVVGRDVSSFLGKSKNITLKVKKLNSTEYEEIPIKVSRTINIPYGDFNNTVFINQTNLTALLQKDMEINDITLINKLQISGRKRFLTSLTNDDVVLSSLDQNVSYWNRLSNLNIWAIGIKSLLLGLCCAFLVLAIVLNSSRDKLLIHYIWGIDYNPLLKYSVLSYISFSVGAILTWLVNLIQCLQKQITPDFLHIPELVPNTINFSPHWTAVPLLLLGIMLLFIVVYFIFNYILIQTQKALNKSDLS